METNTLIFVRSWMEPLRKLPSESRWKVMEAVVEHATTGSFSIELSPMEDMAFTFIRIEIDRMRRNYDSVCDKRRAAANARWSKRTESAMPDSLQETDSESGHASYDDGCKCIPCNADDYKKNIKTDTETYTETDTETKTMKTSTSSQARACEGRSAGKRSSTRSKAKNQSAERYDDSMLLGRFFSRQNQANIEALAQRHCMDIADLRRIAEDITVQWALTEKMHSSYQDASLHLVYALGERIERDRRKAHQDIMYGYGGDMNKRGVLGVDEYIDKDGRRTYNGFDFIPLDAPPRPGKAFWWNRTTNSWDDIQ